MKIKFKHLEILFIFLPILVAVVQIYLAGTSDLSRWKGGGFGMYSDPHPGVNRLVWVEGYIDSVLTAVRLEPLDERLQHESIKNSSLKAGLMKLNSTAWNNRNFPSGWRLSSLDTEYHYFLENHGNEILIKEHFPVNQLKMKVMEVAISDNYQAIGATVICERPLCSH